VEEREYIEDMEIVGLVIFYYIGGAGVIFYL